MKDDKVTPYLAEYWNGEGGQRWVDNLARTEIMLAPLGEAMLTAAAPAPGESVLDVGCGSGATSARVTELVGSGGRVLGVDVSATILDVARRNWRDLPNLKFKLADAATLESEDQRFDLLVSRMGVMFFSDPAAAFTNLARALKPRGRMSFVCWAEREANSWMMLPAAAAFEIVSAPPPSDPEDPGPFSFADRVRARTILEQAGFSDVRIDPYAGVLDMGTLDSALHLATHMGPAAKPIEEAGPHEASQAIAAVRAVLSKHLAGGRVQLPFKSWIVTARA